jgi:hypothetical protein
MVVVVGGGGGGGGGRLGLRVWGRWCQSGRSGAGMMIRGGGRF